MTITGKRALRLITAVLAGAAALAAAATLDVVTGPRLGVGQHETLIALTERIVRWVLTGGLAFVALRLLLTTTGSGR